MRTSLKKASELNEISTRVSDGPLKYSDKRYVNLGMGWDSNEMKKLRLQIRDASAREERFAKFVLAGARGSGKTTELRQLEYELADQFTPIYIAISNNVLRDCDHIDIMVWLVETLIRRYSIRKWPVDANRVITVTDWFARKGFEDYEVVKEEIRSESGTEFQAEYGFYWLPILMLNRIKSLMFASAASRRLMRERLQTYANEMVFHVNKFLDEARETLVRLDKSPDLLLLIDNLDHMPPDVAWKFFYDGADVLHELRVHMIYTAPLATRLPPFHVEDSFQHCFKMPLIRLHESTGDEFRPGLKKITDVIRQRINIRKLFEDVEVVSYLGKMSGGNLRDLMQLVNYAQQETRGAKKRLIDMVCAENAVDRLSRYYEKMLIPHDIYYPILSRIMRTKHEHFLPGNKHTADAVQNARFFGSELLNLGAVLERDDGMLYDLHPVIPGIPTFRDFCKD